MGEVGGADDGGTGSGRAHPVEQLLEAAMQRCAGAHCRACGRALPGSAPAHRRPGLPWVLAGLALIALALIVPMLLLGK